MSANQEQQRYIAPFDVVIIRSKRRKKTISTRLINWHKLEIRAPAQLSQRDLERAIRDSVQKMARRVKKFRSYHSDGDLDERARILNEQFFDGQLRWRSIRFVSNQHKRFGSCSPVRGTIRISDRLSTTPQFVLDYVIIHELTHLLEPNHSQAFWQIVNGYEFAERARGYLIALELEEDLPCHELSDDTPRKES